MQEGTYAEKRIQSATYKTITYLKFVSSEVQVEKTKNVIQKINSKNIGFQSIMMTNQWKWIRSI